MTTRLRCLLAAGLFFAGLLAGVYLQHRWPVGRWNEPRRPAATPATLSLSQIAALPAERRLVIVVAGQSNAANYGSVRATGGPGVYAWHEGALFQADDPMPGGDSQGGSPWTRLGASLVLSGNYDAVVFAVLAQGSSRVDQWAPGGRFHPRLIGTLHSLNASGTPADFILWQQGESEGWSATASGTGYLDSLRSLIASTQTPAPRARWVIARATYANGIIGNAQIREAQRLAANLPGAFAGPDLDELDAGYRHDGVHFNRSGLDAAASLWRQSLDPLLAARRAP